MLKKLLRLILSLFGKDEDKPTPPPVIPGPHPPQQHPMALEKIENRQIVKRDGAVLRLASVGSGWELCPWAWGEPVEIEFPRYLDHLSDVGVNMLRAWTVEYTNSEQGHREQNGHRPKIMPWKQVETYHGELKKRPDGGRPYDFREVNPAYLRHVREVAQLCFDRGIYCMVMLFEGVSSSNENHWWGHVARGTEYDNRALWHREVLPPHRRLINALVHELRDFPNVCYEVVNEDTNGSVKWQHDIIWYLKQQLQASGSLWWQPIMMSFRQKPKTRAANDELYSSPADLVSPRYGRRLILDADCPPHQASIMEDDHWDPYALRPNLDDPTAVHLYSDEIFDKGHAGSGHLDYVRAWAVKKFPGRQARHLESLHVQIRQDMGRALRERTK